MTTFTKPLLVADKVAGASPSSPSVGFELQSTTSAMLPSRLTTAQINALSSVDGMIAYNTDTGAFNLAQGGAWASFSPTAAQSVTVNITNAQLLNMFAAPVPLLPAPGPGKMIVVTDFMMEHIFNSAAFQAGGAIALSYILNNYAASASIAADLLTTANSGLYTVGSTAARRVVGATQNQGIGLTNATGAFTTGDGTARVTLLYVVISV